MQLRLSSRLIISVSLIVGLMLSLFIWNSSKLTLNSQKEQLKQYIDDQADILSVALVSGLANNDQDLLNEIVKRLRNNPNIIYLIVYDNQQQVKAAFSPEHHPYKHTYNSQGILDKNAVDLTLPLEQKGISLGEVHLGYSIKNLIEKTRITKMINIGIALSGLLITILLTALLSFYITRGLRWLEAGARAMEKNDLQFRIPLNSRDEIGNVARSFNALAEHLQQASKKLNSEYSLLESEKHRMETLLNSVNAVVLEMDPHSKDFLYVSQEAETLLGYSCQQWLETGFWEHHLHPDDTDWVISTINEQLSETGDFSLDYRLRHCNGEYIWIRSIHSLSYDPDMQLHYRGLFLDITQEKKSEQRILYLANHDSLTGLHNRNHFQEQLTHQINYAVRFNLESTLLFIDLDQFKYINDTLGHQSGDKCLITAAQTLQASLREVDIIGRLGGDEFGIILPRTDENGALKVAHNLLENLAKQTLFPDKLSVTLSASIGITLFPTHSDSPSELLAQADAAMYTAKRDGRNRAHVYSDQDKELLNMQTKIQWESRIRHALDNDLFVLHYQPIVDLRTHRIAHYEALLRMQDEDGQLIYPSDFLEIAERFGLINDIDKWVLNKSIQVQGETRHNPEPVTLAVNLSGRHFGSTEFIDLVKDALKKYHADPHSLIFEVTETAAVENFSQAKSFINALRSLGCRFALDDFGMGYSSFQYLKNLPVDMVKIDGNFVRNLHNNHDDRVIVKAMCELARGMHIHTIAEFVENEEIMILLQEFGIDYGQGFYIAYPEAKFKPQTTDSLITKNASG
ncbi:diguanylate cyclase/phosphodiesterase (GGDEF & EAL domains) with PAS/PAC sensor(s) [hydrothermal vent metagenome]|uniref:Diguanylate cyclase/phosphodiesterase (GGDEF & EAL domains) with PAS/PAC sensor(S) n=1 Tax=hydrothermal vent metagenome TaxID=652676 RepID=A0A3B1B4V8_9ZZZZ